MTFHKKGGHSVPIWEEVLGCVQYSLYTPGWLYTEVDTEAGDWSADYIRLHPRNLNITRDIFSTLPTPAPTTHLRVGASYDIWTQF